MQVAFNRLSKGKKVLTRGMQQGNHNLQLRPKVLVMENIHNRTKSYIFLRILTHLTFLFVTVGPQDQAARGWQQTSCH